MQVRTTAYWPSSPWNSFGYIVQATDAQRRIQRQQTSVGRDQSGKCQLLADFEQWLVRRVASGTIQRHLQDVEPYINTFAVQRSRYCQPRSTSDRQVSGLLVHPQGNLGQSHFNQGECGQLGEVLFVHAGEGRDRRFRTERPQANDQGSDGRTTEGDGRIVRLGSATKRCVKVKSENE